MKDKNHFTKSESNRVLRFVNKGLQSFVRYA